MSTHLLPDGVALGNAERSLGIIDVVDSVIAHHGRQAGQPRHDTFGAAAEPGEEMRLDEARDDTDVGLDEVAVQQGRGAVVGRAKLDQGARILGFVVQNAVVLHDGWCQKLLKFGAGIGAMRAKGVEQGDLLGRRPRPGSSTARGSGGRWAWRG